MSSLQVCILSLQILYIYYQSIQTFIICFLKSQDFLTLSNWNLKYQTQAFKDSCGYFDENKRASLFVHVDLRSWAKLVPDY